MPFETGKLSEVETVCRLLVNDLVTNGIFTPGGRQPRATLDKYLAALAAWDRMAQRIGLDRKARKVETLADVLAKHEEGLHHGA